MKIYFLWSLLGLLALQLGWAKQFRHFPVKNLNAWEAPHTTGVE